jgi:hypothetical protein
MVRTMRFVLVRYQQGCKEDENAYRRTDPVDVDDPLTVCERLRCHPPSDRYGRVRPPGIEQTFK